MSTRAELNAHDPQLERAILYAFHVWPWQHDEAYATFPADAFYLERHRRMWRAQAEQYREHGSYPPGAIITRLKTAGHHDDAAHYADICVGANVQDDTWPACHADLAIDALLALYQRRQRALAISEYEAALAKGGDETPARLMLDMHLDGIETMRHHQDAVTSEDIAAMLAEGSTRPTGFSALDAISGGLAAPGLNILAARPSVGKSALARGIIRERAKRGDRVYWYSQDQSINQIYELEITRLTGKTAAEIKSTPRAELEQLVNRVRSDAWRDRVTLLDRPSTLTQLLGYIRAVRPDLVVVDYLQLVDAGFDSEYENVTATSKALKTLAFQLRAPVLALAQFNRGAAKGDTLSMAHLRASGQIEQDADQIWALERDTTLSSRDDQPATLTVMKNKVGSTGNVQLMWVSHAASFRLQATPAQRQMADAARAWEAN
jgi:replicative DNA helicase